MTTMGGGAGGALGGGSGQFGGGGELGGGGSSPDGGGGQNIGLQMAETAGGPGLSAGVIAEALAGEGDAAAGDEEDAAALRRRIAALEADLARAEARLAAQGMRLTLERELAAAGVIDLETGVTLAERLLEGGDEDDPVRAVARLRARKPFLFPDGGTARESAARASSMSGDVDGPGSAALDEMAGSARASGDRRELLRYLRARWGI